MTPAAAPAPALVRLFVGHVGTPVWLDDLIGPVDPARLGLDALLAADLLRWEADWHDSRDAHLRWTAATPEAEHRHRGVALAERLAAALGRAAVVEVDEPGGSATRRVHVDAPPRQPAAAETFGALVRAARAEEERVRAAVAAAGPGARSRVVAPVSGVEFRRPAAGPEPDAPDLS